MKIRINITTMTVLFLSLASTATYADWNRQCLEDCFSTHHECNYCDYQCYVDGSKPPQARYSDPVPCPFQNDR